MEQTLKIEGMSCNHCVKHVTEALQQIDGVTGVTVNLEAKTAVVSMDAEIPMATFAAAIEDAGYDVVQ